MVPTVSILLPFWNASPCLPAALDSLRAQSFQDWETVLIDDGSTDDSAAIARSFADRDPRFRLVRRPHRGIVAALREAQHLTRGGILARMDADDLSYPDRLARQVAALANEPDLGVVATRVDFGGDREREAGYAAHVDWTNRLLSPEDHFRERFVESPLSHPTAMWRRNVMQQHGGYRETEGPEDYELWLRWLDAGVRFRKLPDPGLRWNDPPGRLSRTAATYRVDAFYRVKARYLARVLPTDRPLWLWGSGRTTRRRFAELERLRGPFSGFIDVNPNKIGQHIDGRPVLAPHDAPADAFLLTGVATRGARDRMEAFLLRSGRRWGRDYWLCA